MNYLLGIAWSIIAVQFAMHSEFVMAFTCTLAAISFAVAIEVDRYVGRAVEGVHYDEPVL